LTRPGLKSDTYYIKHKYLFFALLNLELIQQILAK